MERVAPGYDGWGRQDQRPPCTVRTLYARQHDFVKSGEQSRGHGNAGTSSQCNATDVLANVPWHVLAELRGCENGQAGAKAMWLAHGAQLPRPGNRVDRKSPRLNSST